MTSKSSLSNIVYERLRGMIDSGQLKPGHLFTENQFSSELRVSRTPVREAVRRLMGEKSIELTARGFRVHTPSIVDLADVYFTRAIIEGAAAGAATRGATKPLVAGLKRKLSSCLVAIRSGCYEDVAKLNGEFHWDIIRAAGSDRIIGLLESLNPFIVRYRRISLAFPEHVTRSYEDHLKIVALIQAGDMVEAERVVRVHILEAGKRIVTAVARMEGVDTTGLPLVEALLDGRLANFELKVGAPPILAAVRAVKVGRGG